jgi:hypothetical protein
MEDSATISRDQLPPRLIRFLEITAQAFAVDTGPAIVELNFQDGHFEYAWLKRRIRVGDLPDLQDSFDEAFDAFLGEQLRS